MDDGALRDHLVNLLEGKGAHRSLEEVFRGVPMELRGVRQNGLPYSIWELLEHIRISQWDILEFSLDSEHVSLEWPEGYWPKNHDPGSEQAWDRSLERVKGDLSRMVSLVRDKTKDLLVPFSWGEGQTLLREALLVADHNAYHAGQAVALRRMLGVWPPQTVQ